MVRGFSLVLVTFVMIVMLVFGLLSVSSAGADYRLSQKAAKTQQIYYGLDSRGETLRMVCDGAAAQAFAAGGGAAFRAALISRLKSLAKEQGFSVAASGDDVTVSAALVSSDNSSYKLKILLSCPVGSPKKAPLFSTKLWQMSAGGTQINGGSLNVWNGK